MFPLVLSMTNAPPILRFTMELWKIVDRRVVAEEISLVTMVKRDFKFGKFRCGNEYRFKMSMVCILTKIGMNRYS